MGGGRRGGGGKQEGTVTLAGGFASHRHGPSPGEERGCHLSAGRERCEAASLHPSPAGTTQGLFCEGMLSFPASQPHTSEPLPAPQPPLQPGPAPRGHASPGSAGKFGAGRHAPMGRFGSGEILVILKISKSQPPNGARQRLAPRPSLRFPSLEPAGTLGTDETLSCGPSKTSGSLF